MQKSNHNQNVSSASTHHTVQKSTTLNRKYVKRPDVKKIMIETDEPEPVKVIEATDLEAAIVEAKEAEAAEKSSAIQHFSVNTTAEVEAAKAAEAAKAIEIAEAGTETSAEKKIIVAIETEEAEEAAEQVLTEEANENAEPIGVITSADENTEPSAVAESGDLPPAENPYQAALDARADALEVRKAAGRSAEFYAGPTPEERKNAEIDKAVAEMEASKKAAAALSKKELRAQKKAEHKAKVMADREMARAAKKAKTAKKTTPAKLEKKAAKKDVASILEKNASSELSKSMKKKGRGRRVVLALACSIACMAALGVFVYNNIPDISAKIAAAQSGIDVHYPTYTPRDFRISGIYVNEKDEVVIDYVSNDSADYTIIQTESAWDSTALLNNYVKKVWGGEEYTAARENGITIYMYGSNAVWVNGGMLYRIEASPGVLTKKQIKNIATSI